MKQYRIIISGGGTGGHIFPAISIANTFKKRFPNAEILFVGAEDRMEMEKVPAAGYSIVGLPVSGFDRTHLLNNVRVIGRLFKSLRLARKTIREFRPDIAVGGYASGPTLWMAASLGIPTLIQEQNSYAGVTNKLLAKKADKICVAYDGMDKFFPADRIVVTGNPVRQDLEEALDKREEALRFFGLSPNKKTVLVVGGSLGARTINRSIQNGLDKLFASDADVHVIWQTGRYYQQEALKHLKAYRGMPIWCSDFITRMDYAYAAADLIISRAGASSISELCLLGKPVILVPSPNVAEDHQTKNAQALVDKNAAVMVIDKEAEKELVSKALELIYDEERLNSLSKNIAMLAQHQSAERIVDEMIKIIK